MYKVRNVKVKVKLNLAKDAKNSVCVSQKRRLKNVIPLMSKASNLVKQSRSRLRYSTDFLLYSTSAAFFPTFLE